MSVIHIELRLDDLPKNDKQIVITIGGKDIDAQIANKAAQTIVQTNRSRNAYEGMGFVAYLQHIISDDTGRKSVRTIETYRCARNSLSRFLDGKDIPLNKLTQDHMGNYEGHLKERGLSMNTISFYMRILRAAYNKAVENGLTDDRKPFAKVYTSIAKTRKRALPLSIVKKIKDFTATDPMTNFARDMFLFSFYAQGMSFVDMAYLSSSNLKGGWLTYQRHKTNQTIVLKWEPHMQEIVDRYHPDQHPLLLPIIHSLNGRERNQYRNKQALVNQRLKAIAKVISTDCNLTMYMARHSWASTAAAYGLPLNLISFGMGHSSEKTTRIYLKSLQQDRIDEVNARIFMELNR